MSACRGLAVCLAPISALPIDAKMDSSAADFYSAAHLRHLVKNRRIDRGALATARPGRRTSHEIRHDRFPKEAPPESQPVHEVCPGCEVTVGDSPMDRPGGDLETLCEL